LGLASPATKRKIETTCTTSLRSFSCLCELMSTRVEKMEGIQRPPKISVQRPPKIRVVQKRISRSNKANSLHVEKRFTRARMQVSPTQSLSHDDSHRDAVQVDDVHENHDVNSVIITNATRSSNMSHSMAISANDKKDEKKKKPRKQQVLKTLSSSESKETRKVKKIGMQRKSLFKKKKRSSMPLPPTIGGNVDDNVTPNQEEEVVDENDNVDSPKYCSMSFNDNPMSIWVMNCLAPQKHLGEEKISTHSI